MEEVRVEGKEKKNDNREEERKRSDWEEEEKRKRSDWEENSERKERRKLTEQRKGFKKKVKIEKENLIKAKRQ